MAPVASDRHIVALAGDPGGAAALTPVIHRMQLDGVPFRLLGYRQAPDIWRKTGLAVESIPDIADDGFMADNLRGAALLMTATSVNGIDRERRAWRLAGRLAIPSLAVLDFWSNYRLRFQGEDGGLVLPDRIAVMDSSAAAEMAAAGFPGELLVVTGQPAFDGLAERKHAFNEERRAGLRLDLGIDDDEALVLFVSQPFADLYGGADKARSVLGFDENEVLNLCRDALEGLAVRRRRKLVLMVRRHPRASSCPLPVRRSEWLRAISGDGIDSHEATLASDLVIGMNSAMLMEAVLLGQIVVSVQPHLAQPDSLPSNRDGRSVPVTRPEELSGILEKAIFDDTWRRRHAPSEAAPQGVATTKVVEVAYALINSVSPLRCHEHV